MGHKQENLGQGIKESHAGTAELKLVDIRMLRMAETKTVSLKSKILIHLSALCPYQPFAVS